MESEEAPPGYIQSLINKITNNISVVCNNLILKYVEDDIVLSINVRTVRSCSADEVWKPTVTGEKSPSEGRARSIKLSTEPCLECCSVPDISLCIVYTTQNPL